MTQWQMLDIIVDVVFVIFVPIATYILYLIYCQLREHQISLANLFKRISTRPRQPKKVWPVYETTRNGLKLKSVKCDKDCKH
jgi:hypothetical protein